MKCCKKCGYEHERKPGDFEICWNINCECHKPISTPTEGWESKLTKMLNAAGVLTPIGNDIFLLVRQEKERSVQETLEFIADGEGWEESREHYRKLLAARSPKP